MDSCGDSGLSEADVCFALLGCWLEKAGQSPAEDSSCAAEGKTA